MNATGFNLFVKYKKKRCRLCNTVVPKHTRECPNCFTKDHFTPVII